MNRETRPQGRSRSRRDLPAPPLDPERFEVRSYRPGDEPRVLELHNRAFASHEDRTMEQWDWKYRHNPLGRTELAVVMDRREQRCVCVYAGLKLSAVLDGEACYASQQIDVALDPRFQGGLAGASVLVPAMRHYFDEFTGGETRLGFGYPEPALHRMGLRFARFEVLRDVNFLVRAPRSEAEAGGQDGSQRGGDAGVRIREVDRFGDEVDDLWEACRSEIGTGLVRDAAYLNWRYPDQPGVAHRLFEARGPDGSLRGLTVTREGGWHPDLLSVLDWLVPHEDRDAERALVAVIHRAAREARRSHIATWFAGAPVWLERFQTDHGFRSLQTPYQECFRSWAVRADRRWLHEHWYQTMGDIDFF